MDSLDANWHAPRRTVNESNFGLLSQPFAENARQRPDGLCWLHLAEAILTGDGCLSHGCMVQPPSGRNVVRGSSRAPCTFHVSIPSEGTGVIIQDVALDRISLSHAAAGCRACHGACTISR